MTEEYNEYESGSGNNVITYEYPVKIAGKYVDTVFIQADKKTVNNWRARIRRLQRELGSKEDVFAAMIAIALPILEQNLADQNKGYAEGTPEWLAYQKAQKDAMLNAWDERVAEYEQFYQRMGHDQFMAWAESIKLPDVDRFLAERSQHIAQTQTPAEQDRAWLTSFLSEHGPTKRGDIQQAAFDAGITDDKDGKKWKALEANARRWGYIRPSERGMWSLPEGKVLPLRKVSNAG